MFDPFYRMFRVAYGFCCGHDVVIGVICAAVAGPYLLRLWRQLCDPPDGLAMSARRKRALTPSFASAAATAALLCVICLAYGLLVPIFLSRPRRCLLPVRSVLVD